MIYLALYWLAGISLPFICARVYPRAFEDGITVGDCLLYFGFFAFLWPLVILALILQYLIESYGQRLVDFLTKPVSIPGIKHGDNDGKKEN